MRFFVPIGLAALCLLLAASGGASSTTRLNVSPKHGHPKSTYTISFKAEFASSKATKTDYVIGALNSTSANCHRGISSFGYTQSGPYKVGQTVRFLVHPKAGLCPGVFHGVAHWQKREGDHFRDVRVGRFAFRVLSR
jgi:hypothetical protein